MQPNRRKTNSHSLRWPEEKCKKGERVLRSPWAYFDDAKSSVLVMLRLVRPIQRHAEVAGLFLRELGELHAELFEVQTGDFFVELDKRLP